MCLLNAMMALNLSSNAALSYEAETFCSVASSRICFSKKSISRGNTENLQKNVQAQFCGGSGRSFRCVLVIDILSIPLSFFFECFFDVLSELLSVERSHKNTL